MNIPIHERMLWCSEAIQVMPNQTNGLEKMQILSINEIVSKEENLFLALLLLIFLHISLQYGATASKRASVSSCSQSARMPKYNEQTTFQWRGQDERRRSSKELLALGHFAKKIKLLG